jgi:LuxR family maltose regulon positive regulatory protein
MIESGNTSLLPVAEAFQAEVNLRQGRLAIASQWARELDSPPPILPMFRLYEPHFTLVKIWLALDTPTNRKQAAELLSKLRNFTESINNTVCLIQVLCLEAVLCAAEDDEESAIALLKKAIELALPGSFIRLFIDTGTSVNLLEVLRNQGVAPEYIDSILAAYPKSAAVQGPQITRDSLQHTVALVDVLTPRELEVLQLLSKRLTNKEIAGTLIVSPETVKTHTLSIYAKLNVHSRRQAVEKARELNLIPLS